MLSSINDVFVFKASPKAFIPLSPILLHVYQLIIVPTRSFFYISLSQFSFLFFTSRVSFVNTEFTFNSSPTVIIVSSSISLSVDQCHYPLFFFLCHFYSQPIYSSVIALFIANDSAIIFPPFDPISFPCSLSLIFLSSYFSS